MCAVHGNGFIDDGVVRALGLGLGMFVSLKCNARGWRARRGEPHHESRSRRRTEQKGGTQENEIYKEPPEKVNILGALVPQLSPKCNIILSRLRSIPPRRSFSS